MSRPSIPDLIAQRFGQSAAGDAAGDQAAALAPILARRSHRRFLPDPVDEDLLSALLACAQSAPSKSDLQQYAIIRVEDAAVRQALGAQGKHLDWPSRAPVLLIFCGDVRRTRRLARLRDRDYANDNADRFMNAAVDTALAMQTFMLAAEAVGLGCCPLSVVRMCIEETSACLGLPAGVFPVAGLAAGRPSGEWRVSMRLPPPSVVVHRDRYDDSNLEAEIAAYDQRRHAREPLETRLQRHVDRYGISDPCPWSDSVTRQLSVPEREEFSRFLAAQGIHLK